MWVFFSTAAFLCLSCLGCVGSDGDALRQVRTFFDDDWKYVEFLGLEVDGFLFIRNG